MTSLTDTLVAVQVGNAEMLVPGSNDRLHDIYQSHRWYEADLLEAIRARQHGGVFVDIGANHGNHTVFFAVECGADRVVAVEPYPGEYEILLANIAHSHLEAIVDPVDALIHPSWKSVTLGGHPDRSPLPETWWYSNQPVVTEGGATVAMTLDELLANVNVDVIKIDVEETGPEVLASGVAMLKRCRPLVAIEAEPSEQEAVAATLEPLGYRIAGCFCATPTFLWEP